MNKRTRKKKDTALAQLDTLRMLSVSCASMATSLEVLTQLFVKMDQSETAQKVADRLTGKRTIEAPRLLTPITDSFWLAPRPGLTVVEKPDPNDPSQFIEVARQ